MADPGRAVPDPEQIPRLIPVRPAGIPVTPGLTAAIPTRSQQSPGVVFFFRPIPVFFCGRSRLSPAARRGLADLGGDPGEFPAGPRPIAVSSGPMPARPGAVGPLPAGSRCCAVPREEEPAAGADRGGAGPGWARVAGGPRRTM